jgi:cytochrome c oxidase subunit I+III
LLVAATTYAAVAFSYLYLWMGSPGLWPSAKSMPSLASVWGAALLLALAAATIAYARHALGRDRKRSMAAALVISAAALCAAFVVDLVAMLDTALSPRDSSYGAIVYALIALQGVYVVLIALMIGYTLARAWTQRLDQVRRATFDNSALIGYYTVAQGAVTLGLVHGFPRWVG